MFERKGITRLTRLPTEDMRFSSQKVSIVCKISNWTPTASLQRLSAANLYLPILLSANGHCPFRRWLRFVNVYSIVFVPSETRELLISVHGQTTSLRGSINCFESRRYHELRSSSANNEAVRIAVPDLCYWRRGKYLTLTSPIRRQGDASVASPTQASSVHFRWHWSLRK